MLLPRLFSLPSVVSLSFVAACGEVTHAPVAMDAPAPGAPDAASDAGSDTPDARLPQAGDVQFVGHVTGTGDITPPPMVIPCGSAVPAVPIPTMRSMSPRTAAGT